MSKTVAVVAIALLTACSPRVVTQDRPVTVLRPVAVPCALERPKTPAPLPDDWETLDVRQKASVVSLKLIEWANYGEALNAATAGCE